jgi:hypothetical protein
VDVLALGEPETWFEGAYPFDAEDDSCAVIEALGVKVAQLQKELAAARAALEVAAVPVAQICASIRKAGASYALADDIAEMAMALRDAAASVGGLSSRIPGAEDGKPHLRGVCDTLHSAAEEADEEHMAWLARGAD